MSTDETSMATQSFGAEGSLAASDSDPSDGSPATETVPSSRALEVPEQEPTEGADPKKRDTFDPYRFGRIQFSTQVFRRLLAIPLPEVPEEDLIRKGEAALGAIPVRPIQRAAPEPGAVVVGSKPRMLPLLLLVLGLGGLGGFLLLRSTEAPTSAQVSRSIPTEPKEFKVTLPRSEGRAAKSAEAVPASGSLSTGATQEPPAGAQEIPRLNPGSAAPHPMAPTPAPSERSPSAPSGKSEAQGSSKAKAWFEMR